MHRAGEYIPLSEEQRLTQLIKACLLLQRHWSTPVLQAGLAVEEAGLAVPGANVQARKVTMMNLRVVTGTSRKRRRITEDGGGAGPGGSATELSGGGGDNEDLGSAKMSEILEPGEQMDGAIYSDRSELTDEEDYPEDDGELGLVLSTIGVLSPKGESALPRHDLTFGERSERTLAVWAFAHQLCDCFVCQG